MMGVFSFMWHIAGQWKRRGGGMLFSAVPLAIAMLATPGALTVHEGTQSPASTAIAWAQGYLGQDFDNGECLQFVASAYAAAGINIGSTDTAADYWTQNPEGYAEHPGNVSPPVGALVFWGPSDVGGVSNPAGHVGIYVGTVAGEGSDEVISTWSWPEPASQPDVHYFSLSGRNAAGYPYDGWLAPFPLSQPEITTTSLSSDRVATSYLAQLAVVGGTAPYTWALSAGSLPPGLTLAPGGAISGTPTSSGTFPFAIMVTDADGATATQALSITVGPQYENSAVEGAGHSLDFYYNIYGSPAWGQNVVAGTGTTYSAPSIAIMSNGETVIAAEGVNHSLDFYYNVFGQPTWTLNVVGGAGTTYSPPSIAVMGNGETVIAAEGKTNSLDFYYNSSGTPQWPMTEVAGTNTTDSQPSIATMTNDETVIAAQGASHSLDFYYNVWGQPAWTLNLVGAAGTTYSAPSIATMTNDETVISADGSGHSLDFYYNSYGTPQWPLTQVAGQNTTYSAPSIATMSNGESVIAAQGRTNSLDFYYNAWGQPAWTLNLVGAAGTTYSAPSIATMTNSEAVISALGASNSFDFYYNSYGTPQWPLNVMAGPGTSFTAGSIAVPPAL